MILVIELKSIRRLSMNQDKYFSFEDGKYDFPLYDKKDLITSKTGIGLILSLIIFIFLVIGPIKFHNIQEQIILFFSMAIPLLYITGGKLGDFVRKPELNDIKLIILCVFGNFLLLFIITSIVTIINTIVPFNPLETIQYTGNFESLSNILLILANFLQIIGEELFRIIPFILIMHLVFKNTHNRKLAIILGTFGCLLLTGLMHINSYSNIIYCIVVMGFGSFFTLYAYLKSKNLLLSIIVHALYNLMVILIHMLTTLP